ncbi:hypothetical protein [Nocardia sp. NPDC057668]|uniref:hypothetical protein n=1 Tax=Nocardia sp. NPDC057668 TaxID=3346202 RepID=UPI00366FC0A2
MVSIQYYFSLGLTDQEAVHRVQDTVRFLLGCRVAPSECELDTGRRVEAGRAVNELELTVLMASAIANMNTATGIPQQRVTPMLGLDWASAWAWSRPLQCPHCDSGNDDFDMFEWLYSGVEVSADCPTCGFTGLIGDWNLEHSMLAMTNCCVALRGWPILPEDAAEVHVQALRLIGDRSRYLRGGL